MSAKRLIGVVGLLSLLFLAPLAHPIVLYVVCLFLISLVDAAPLVVVPFLIVTSFAGTILLPAFALGALLGRSDDSRKVRAGGADDFK